MACSICREERHTKRTCKNKKEEKVVGKMENTQDIEFSEKDTEEEKERLFKEIKEYESSLDFKDLRQIRQALRNKLDRNLCTGICNNANVTLDKMHEAFFLKHRSSYHDPKDISDYLSYIYNNKGILSFEKMKEFSEKNDSGNLLDSTFLIEGGEKYLPMLKTFLSSYLDWAGKDGGKTDSGAGERALALLLSGALKKEGSDVIVKLEEKEIKVEIKGNNSRVENNKNASISTIRNLIISLLKRRGFNDASEKDFEENGKHSYNFNSKGLTKLNNDVKIYNTQHSPNIWDLKEFIKSIVSNGLLSVKTSEVDTFVEEVIKDEQITDIQLFLNKFAELQLLGYKRENKFDTMIVINKDTLNFTFIKDEKELFDKLNRKVLGRHDSLNWNTGRGFGLQIKIS